MIFDRQQNNGQNGVGPDLTISSQICDRFEFEMGPCLRVVKNEVYRPHAIHVKNESCANMSLCVRIKCPSPYRKSVCLLYKNEIL